MKAIDKLNKFMASIRSVDGYKEPLAWAIGRSEKSIFDSSKTINVNYAVLNYKENYISAAIIIDALLKSRAKVRFNESEAVYEINKNALNIMLKKFDFLKFKTIGENYQNLQNLLVIQEIIKNKKFNKDKSKFCITFIYDDVAPKSIECIYLKLYLLSTLKVDLKSLNLDGIFSILPNIAWNENARAIELEWLRKNEIWLKMSGNYPRIVSVDKFPRYLSHVIPTDNTRVLDDSKVRMGAVLAPGTTVMPGASYVNFNSGTKGAAMIEGRVSSAVEVGEGSDIGGGASILGVLSGTNGNAVTIGKKCLLGANSVTGIPLGDNCVIDAGIAVLEGTKVYIDNKDQESLSKLNPEFKFEREIYKAIELAGLNGLHFRLDSQTGKMLCVLNRRAVKLNENLH